MNLPMKSHAVFCPKCGSAFVERAALSASCKVCDWKGEARALAHLDFEHGFGTDEELDHAFFLDVRRLLGEMFAVEIGRFLLRWGFLPSLEGKFLARYVSAAAKGVVRAVFEERAQIEKEIHGNPS